jgi:phenylpropionate dioxygenase-like ring-hydroxylating dioxygenase large terminal subunit
MNFTPQLYVNEGFFSFEREVLFRTSWFYVARNDEVINDGDYKTVNIYGTELFLRNCKGVVKCFENKCVHRFAKIFTEDNGNSKIICKYHGFLYDDDGCLKNTRFQEFNSCSKLKEVTTEVVGGFIFISFQKELSLKDHLGPYYLFLEDIGLKLNINLDEQKIHHSANWKLLVENVLESFHCPLVHSETLFKDGYCVGQNHEEFGSFGCHSHWKIPKVSNEFDKRKFRKLKFLSSDTRLHQGFHHYYIFPNLVISSTQDYLFYVGRLEPLNVSSTLLHVEFWKQDDLNSCMESNSVLQNLFFKGCVDSGLKVLFEDKPFVESCHVNLSSSSMNEEVRFVHSKEFRILKFYEEFNALIGEYES